MRLNKFNLLFLLFLSLAISLSCNFIRRERKDTPDEKSRSENEVKGSENNASTEEDNLAVEVEDEPIDATTLNGDKDSKTNEINKQTRTVVKFGKGKTSRGYERSVIRGEKHTYILEAGKGQIMSVNITSLEDNAGFYILSPSQTYVGDGLEERGVKRYNGKLPESGKYKIVVSPSRGNAIYKINFGVSARPKTEIETATKSGGGGKTTVVKFRKGGTSATYSNSVIRAERDTYILGASGGQVMSVSVSSTENNAAFSIRAPNGRTLANEVKDWSGQLPADGKYRIVVSPTRGNATYRVRFAVR